MPSASASSCGLTGSTRSTGKPGTSVQTRAAPAPPSAPGVVPSGVQRAGGANRKKAPPTAHAFARPGPPLTPPRPPPRSAAATHRRARTRRPRRAPGLRLPPASPPPPPRAQWPIGGADETAESRGHLEQPVRHSSAGARPLSRGGAATTLAARRHGGGASTPSRGCGGEDACGDRRGRQGGRLYAGRGGGASSLAAAHGRHHDVGRGEGGRGVGDHLCRPAGGRPPWPHPPAGRGAWSPATWGAPRARGQTRRDRALPTRPPRARAARRAAGRVGPTGRTGRPATRR